MFHFLSLEIPTINKWHSLTYISTTGVQIIGESSEGVKNFMMSFVHYLHMSADWRQFHNLIKSTWLKLIMQCQKEPSMTRTTFLKVGKSQKHFFLKLHCPKIERNI